MVRGFQSRVRHPRRCWHDASGEDARFRSLIRHHVTCDLLGTIGHVENAYAADPDARQQLLSPEVLTARAAGFDSIAELVKVEIRDMRRLRDAG